jgi:hypothetical protein
MHEQVCILFYTVLVSELYKHIFSTKKSYIHTHKHYSEIKHSVFAEPVDKNPVVTVASALTWLLSEMM